MLLVRNRIKEFRVSKKSIVVSNPLNFCRNKRKLADMDQSGQRGSSASQSGSRTDGSQKVMFSKKLRRSVLIPEPPCTPTDRSFGPENLPNTSTPVNQVTHEDQDGQNGLNSDQSDVDALNEAMENNGDGPLVELEVQVSSNEDSPQEDIGSTEPQSDAVPQIESDSSDCSALVKALDASRAECESYWWRNLHIPRNLARSTFGRGRKRKLVGAITPPFKKLKEVDLCDVLRAMSLGMPETAVNDAAEDSTEDVGNKKSGDMMKLA